MTKRTVFILWTALCVLLLSGCVATEGGLVQTVVVTATPTALPEGAKIVLRVGTGDSGEGLSPHLRIIEQFEAENPDIQVQLEPVGSLICCRSATTPCRCLSTKGLFCRWMILLPASSTRSTPASTCPG
jgi:ABC-type molybdate transport system substrate-binding protein